MVPKASPTHFLCIPLVTTTSRPQLSKSLAAFVEDVTSSNSFAVPSAAVRPVGTLHLTLGVMALSTPADRGKAIEILRSLRPRELLAGIRLSRQAAALQQAPGQVQKTEETTRTSKAAAQPSLSITLRGLHSMQTPALTSVLYAPPTDSRGILHAFCEKLRAPFIEQGLIMDENRPLLLHATIVNTVYVRDGHGRQRGRRGTKLTLDARGILDRYEDYVWMDNVPVEKIAICRMGAKKVEGDEDDQAYEVEAEIDF